MISAISYDKIIANHIVEGGVDAVVFENFIFHILTTLRRNEESANREILLLLDNATIHRH